jgi:hypothetical protein
MEIFAAAEHINEKFDKSQFKPSNSNKSITFKTPPAALSPSKPNELGEFFNHEKSQFVNLKKLFPVYSIKRRDLKSSEAKDNSIASTTTTFSTNKMSATQNHSPKTPVDGIGPTTHEGMPTSLRSVKIFILLRILIKINESYSQEVTDSSRDQWYKKMYNTIHKAKDDGEIICC